MPPPPRRVASLLCCLALAGIPDSGRQVNAQELPPAARVPFTTRVSPGVHASDTAQAAPTAAPASGWTVSLQNLSRIEAWSFFAPPPTGGDPDYALVGNRLRVTAQYRWSRGLFVAAGQYTQLGGLPERAFGPGALGTGGLYYDHAKRRHPGQLYPKLLFVRSTVGPGVSIQAGRFGYASGSEAPSGRPKVEAVKRLRVDSRMIGEFEWSLFQRSFDGVRVDVDRTRWHVSGAAFWPTQGGFEDVAGPTITDVGTAAVTVAMRPGTILPATDLSGFAYYYDDRRAVTARPDNTGLSASKVNVRIASFGASAVGSTSLGAGELDWLAWGVGQTGSWYGQDHRAWSLVLEGGYQWKATPWQPWIRGGYLHASGDDDPRDAVHGTFFQMLPTVRKYSYTASYAQMNMRDVFGEIILRPSPRLGVRGDVRQLWLADPADRWYAGSGATQSRGSFFGYAARPSGGRTGFGTVMEGACDVTLSKHWSVNAFIGSIRGGDVVHRSFAGRWLTFFYLENVISL